VTTHVLSAALVKPAPLPDAAWASIDDVFRRLREACGRNDRPLIVGSAKDLVEAVARVVLDVRGEPAGSQELYDAVLGRAHALVEHQPGDGIARDAPVRQAATQAKKMAGLLRELRNTYGTGHGRATLPTIEDEVLETCIDASLLWVRWVLRRLGALMLGQVDPLIMALTSEWFTAGELAGRLRAANLPALDPAEQRRLGVAVGQRSSRDTFVVRIDGVETCANDPDDARWPAAYREGLVIGLFVDPVGQLRVDEGIRAPRLAAQVLSAHPAAATVVRELADTATQAAWSQWFYPRWAATVAALDAEARLLPDGARSDWGRLARSIETAGAAYERAYGS
jgi:hypothetical protein